MKVLEILTINNFKNWLKKFNVNESVGKAQNNEWCPIANFLVENNFSNTSVTETEVFVFDTENYLYCFLEKEKDPFYDHQNMQNMTIVGQLPIWVSNFVEIVDSRPENYEIQAETALNILNLVKINIAFKA